MHIKIVPDRAAFKIEICQVIRNEVELILHQFIECNTLVNKCNLNSKLPLRNDYDLLM